MPASESAIEGSVLTQYLAIIYAWTGDKDRAIEQLAEAAKLPGSHVTYGYLRLHPLWDPLRDDPRFEEIVASLAPKSLRNTTFRLSKGLLLLTKQTSTYTIATDETRLSWS